MTIGKLLFGLGIALGLSFSAQAFELNHAEGVVKRDTTPNHIVSYDLGVLDSLAALGITAVGVPRSLYQGTTLEQYQEAPVVGTLFEPDYDALKKLEPDLIFAGGRSAQAIPELEKLAPVAVFNTDTNAYMTRFEANNLALAKAFGKEKEAKELLEKVRTNVAKIQQQNKGQSGVFLFVINDMVMAHAPGDRFGYVYELTGLTSVLPAASPRSGPRVRPEPGSEAAKAAQLEREKVVLQLAQANPDWLLVLDRGAINGAEKTAANTLANHPLLSQTDAFKAGRVVYLEPNPWYVIGSGLNNVISITDSLLKDMKR